MRAAVMLAVIAGATTGAVVGGVEVKPAGAHARLTLSNPAVSDLSGITWIEGGTFAAVSDKSRKIQFVRLKIDPATGGIPEGSWEKTAEVPTAAADFEGIAWARKEGVFYLTAEAGDGLVRFAPASRSASTLAVPPVFARARGNLGLESITLSDAGDVMWIANEEALVPDGPLSDAAAGSLVRLQRFDRRRRPTAQFAWRTEPAAFRYGNAGSGVADLCLLPNGRLLVLERGFGRAGLQLRVFLADFAGAAGTSGQAALAGRAITPAGKTLLYEEATGLTNFEGLALGPPLADGWRSLVVVADSNGTGTHAFLALKVRW